jgi:hypothetical protein
MTNLIWTCRFLLFGIFVVSNAVICSVAVWNFFIAQAINHNLQIDAFLIVIAALSLAFMSFIIICGLVRRHSFVVRVWFDCVWVGVFFALHFSGAVTISSIVPSLMCPSSTAFQLAGSCASTQVLMAFTWICAVCLLAYFQLLFISALVYARTDPRIWNRAVRHFVLSDVPDSAAPLASEPYKRRSFMSIVAPRPRRPAPSALYAFSGGFGNDDEHNAEPSDMRRHSSHRSILPPLPAAPAPQHMVQRAREATVAQVSSFYPQHVQVAIAVSPTNMQPIKRLEASPPPLGDWPRIDALSQPVRGQPRKTPRSSRTGQNSRSSPSKYAVTTVPLVPPAALTIPARSRPSGPRAREASRDWNRPPPLDLSNISSFGDRRRR